MESRVYAQVIHKSYYHLGMLSDLKVTDGLLIVRLVSCSLRVFLTARCSDKGFKNG